MKKKLNREPCVLTKIANNNLELLNKHITVLKTLKNLQPMDISKISEITGYPQQNIWYTLQILEQEGLIEPSVRGTITTENINNIIVRLKDSIQEVSTAYSNLLKDLE